MFERWSEICVDVSNVQTCRRTLKKITQSAQQRPGAVRSIVLTGRERELATSRSRGRRARDVRQVLVA